MAEEYVHTLLVLPSFFQWLSSHLVIVLAITFACIAVTTRLQSAAAANAEMKNSRSTEVPPVPYWLPVLGHIPSMVWDATSFMRRLRDSYKGGAYALNFGGTTHNIIYTPALVTALLNAKDSKASNEEVSEIIGERVFGFPMATEASNYRQADAEMRACYHHLLSESGLSNMVERTVQQIKHTVSNLVSFSRSPVDQAYWERSAKAQLGSDRAGHPVVVANMTDLVRDYCALSSSAAIVGSDLINNYPAMLADLWTVDRAFLHLGAGLPRWVPIPLVTRAHIARRNIIRAFSEFERAMDKHVSGLDPGPMWQNLDDVGPVIKERVQVYRKHGFSMAARAAFDFGLTWATNANSNMLIFWMLNRIYADQDLLARIRAEFTPFLNAVQPKQTLAIAEPPQFAVFDVNGLCSDCPLLKSCYIECLRMDSATWSFKAVKDDFELTSREKSTKSFMMRKGEYIHAAHDLHNNDPAYFPDPELFRPERHIKVDANGHRTADLGTIRPYGGGSSMCKGRFFAYKECMVFTAAILAMWDMEAVGGGEWRLPNPRKATGVFSTSDPTRVWLRRRQLPTV